MAEDALSATKGKAEEFRVEDGLEEGRDDELGELHFEIAKDA